MALTKATQNVIAPEIVTTDTTQTITGTKTFTATIVGNTATSTKLITARTINGIAFDGTADITVPASGSSSAKAWVNFDGTTSGTWAGGASTVTRVVGSTTATITTTNAHGLTTGNSVYVLTGVVAGSYTVTVLTSNTFTITTVATTALTAAPITFQGSTIRSQYNVSSITKNGTGDFTMNFAAPMTDVLYSVIGSCSQDTAFTNAIGIHSVSLSITTGGVRLLLTGAATSTQGPRDLAYCNVAIFGN